MSYTLCVIDMQAHFSAANGQRVIQSCKREIKKAMKDGATILFVEYDGYGPTLPALTGLVKQAGYKKVHTVLKQDNGGGKNVTDYLRQKHLTRANMRVCGVNTNYCVLATVQGINQHMSNSYLSIIADACASSTSQGHKHGLEAMHKLNNVKVLRRK